MKTSSVPPPPKANPVRRGGLWRRLFRLRWWQALLLLGFIAGGCAAAYYALLAMTYNISDLGQMPQLAQVYDADGNLYSRLRGENRIMTSIDKVSPWFIKALIAREDTRFYEHHGVDPRGILRAIVRNLIRHRAAEGASTLTQQLARNSLPLGGKTLHRKIIEAFVALRIERRYSKQQILEFYINRIYYGSQLYGLETASEAYFGKSSTNLDLSEAAMMAGLIRSPTRFSPLKNPTGAARERDNVLDRMVQLKMITEAQAAAAKKETVRVPRLRSLAFQDNYATDAINRELRDLVSQELLDDTELANGGVKIYTTLDPQLEKLATDAVESHLTKIENKPGYEHPKKRDFAPETHGEKPEYLQGALVAIENRTGAIRALVGGRDFERSSYNRAFAPRPVGSAFKPFVYAAAFKVGMFPGAAIDDGPIRPGELKDANLNDVNWSPANSDGQFTGIQPAEIGLIRSRNTMSVRVGEEADFSHDAAGNIKSYTGDVMKVAKDAGLGDIPGSPTSYLGTFDCDVVTLATAYTAFPNAGARRKSYLIERVDDVDGQVLYRAPQDNSVPTLPPGVAWMVSTILEKVMTSGTAADSRSLGFAKPGAGKTGTTNDFKDAWFVGYTSSLTCGVWVGLDKPDTITHRGYGAALALPIWCQLMSKLDARRYPAVAFEPPEPLEHVQLCNFSNRLATQGCIAAGKAYSMDVPVSMIPREKDGRLAYCFAHGGAVPDHGPAASPPPPRATPAPPSENLPGRMLRSLRRFFGGD